MKSLSKDLFQVSCCMRPVPRLGLKQKWEVQMPKFQWRLALLTRLLKNLLCQILVSFLIMTVLKSFGKLY